MFFGRERLIERLLARIGAHGPAGRFVALVGPSGSGKSQRRPSRTRPHAPARCGPWLRTLVHRDRRARAQPIRIARGHAPGDCRRPARRPSWTAEGPRHRTRREADPRQRRGQVVLIIDQLEELFVQSEPGEAASPRRRRRRRRRSAFGRPRGRDAHADFYDAPLRHPDFGELMRLGTDAITPLRQPRPIITRRGTRRRRDGASRA